MELLLPFSWPLIEPGGSVGGRDRGRVHPHRDLAAYVWGP